MTALTFIIPVRHQDNAKDWSKLKANLIQTLRSISSQTNDDWRAVVVANHGADLPEMPPRCEALRVDFPPNQLHEMGSADKEAVLDAFRIDKGRRVLKGMLHARDTRFFMIVDDDDFVHHGLAEFVSHHPEANGWRLDEGYVWGDGGNWLFALSRFGDFCGTSLIVRAENYHLPERFEDATADYMMTMLGSHHRIVPILAERGAPLASLPFRGAIYRVGHAGAHSKSKSPLRKYLFDRSNLKRPWQFAARLIRFRPVTKSIRATYFGR